MWRSPPMLLAAGGAGGAAIATAATISMMNSRPINGSDAVPALKVSRSVTELIGNTPLLELKSLSRATGTKILVKCEHMNPGGSVKDRAALWLVREAEKSEELQAGGTICEGTGGNTGIGLALVAAASGYKTVLAMPASIAKEKVELMRTFGAEVHTQPAVPLADERHYTKVAAAAGRKENSVHTNQFLNLANMRSHYESTAPELVGQTGGRIDGFICASGTGGTMAGIGSYLKKHVPSAKVVLADCAGSGLRNYLTAGEFKDSPGDTIMEGIGVSRLTANFSEARPFVDGVLNVTDKEAIEMAYFLLRTEGLFIGPSAALNVVGAVKLAKLLKKQANRQGTLLKPVVVTVVCDSGNSYRSKMWNKKWLKDKKLTPTSTSTRELDFLEHDGHYKDRSADTSLFAGHVGGS